MCGAGIYQAPSRAQVAIGGLLATIHDGATYFPLSDANGNITEYVDTNGAIVAHREYDPSAKPWWPPVPW